MSANLLFQQLQQHKLLMLSLSANSVVSPCLFARGQTNFFSLHGTDCATEEAICRSSSTDSVVCFARCRRWPQFASDSISIARKQVMFVTCGAWPAFFESLLVDEVPTVAVRFYRSSKRATERTC